LSSLAVSERLADEIQNIQPDTHDLANRRKLLEPSWELSDIQVPGASVSLHSLIDLIKEEFWSSDRKLSGELGGSSNGKFRILIREVGTGNSFTTDFYDYTHFDGLISEAAKDALRLIDPPTVASYYFSIENSTGHYTNTMREVFYSLRNDYDNSGSRALNIWGNTLSARGDYQNAIKKYPQSIVLAPNFAEVHVNLGDALLATGDRTGALGEYTRAIELDQTLERLRRQNQCVTTNWAKD
jgi:tetratricopeptide (TPR) repeat protein